MAAASSLASADRDASAVNLTLFYVCAELCILSP